MSKRVMKTGLLSAACLFTLTGAAHAAVVFSEDFNSYNTTTFRTAWNTTANDVTSSYTPHLVVGAGYTKGPDFALITLPSQVGKFNNGVGWRALPTTVNDSFTLTYKMISTDYQRAGKLMLTDSTGQKGYALEWSTANGEQFDGSGFLKFYKVDRSTGPITTFNDSTGFTSLYVPNGGQILNKDSNNVPYHYATGVPVIIDNTAKTVNYGDTASNPVMASITLSWDKATGTFTISDDGHILATIVDTSFNIFDRIYLTGNTSSLYDDISISTPEPAAAGVASLLVAGAAMRRPPRRRQLAN